MNERPRVVFHTTFEQGATPEITVMLAGEWDMELLDAASEFLLRQVQRLRQRERGSLVCDGWERELAMAQHKGY